MNIGLGLSVSVSEYWTGREGECIGVHGRECECVSKYILGYMWIHECGCMII